MRPSAQSLSSAFAHVLWTGVRPATFAWMRPARNQQDGDDSEGTQRSGPPRVLRGPCDVFLRAGTINPLCFRPRLRSAASRNRRSLGAGNRAALRLQLDDEEPVGGSDDSGVVEVRRGDDCAEVRGDHDEALGGSPVRLGDGGEGLPTARQGAFTAKPGDEVAALDVTRTARRREARAAGQAWQRGYCAHVPPVVGWIRRPAE